MPDNDDTGRKHADTIGAAFAAIGVTAQILDLPGLPLKGDVLDWYDRGGTREQLDALIRDARPWAPGERESVNAEEPQPEPPSIITFTPFVWRPTETMRMRQFLYDKNYIRKFVSTTIGAGGIGKSSLVLVELIAMATKLNLLGVPVPDRLRVAYWGEDPADEIEKRIGAILRFYKIPAEQIEGWLFVDSFRNLPLQIAALDRGVIVYLDAAAVTEALIRQKIDVLVCDPFVKTHAVSENDNGQIDRVVRKFNDICEAADCAIELPQHIRKASTFGRSEVTVDDGRGAGSLKDGVRHARVINPITTAEAPAAQIKEKDRKRYFRTDDGKANMAPPAEKATWFKLISVPLYNNPADPNAFGDEVGVVTRWELPGVFAGLSTHDLPRVQAAIESGGPWARDVQSGDWAGIAIAQTLDLDLTDEVAKERVKRMLSAWIAAKALKVEPRPHPKRANRTQEIVIVGNRIEEELFDET